MTPIRSPNLQMLLRLPGKEEEDKDKEVLLFHFFLFFFLIFFSFSFIHKKQKRDKMWASQAAASITKRREDLGRTPRRLRKPAKDQRGASGRAEDPASDFQTRGTAARSLLPDGGW